MMTLANELTKYWEIQLDPTNKDNKVDNWVQYKKQIHSQRGNHIPHISGTGAIIGRLRLERHEVRVNYLLRVTFLVRQAHFFYHEEQLCEHQAIFYKGKLIEDKLVTTPISNEPKQIEQRSIAKNDRFSNQRFNYDRRAAVNYAERWWDDYNPAYKQFDVDCTNFVSQALHAGGAPMRGYPDRAKGWWYRDNNWSYSWAVAHSLRWYLSGSPQGLKGKEVDSANQLLPGDVICYDFEGDGKWNHNTIVVMKDQEGMPLVNAHTNNSRHRYWSYEDSYAWTPECQYKFFQIGVN